MEIQTKFNIGQPVLVPRKQVMITIVGIVIGTAYDVGNVFYQGRGSVTKIFFGGLHEDMLEPVPAPDPEVSDIVTWVDDNGLVFWGTLPDGDRAAPSNYTRPSCADGE